MAKRRMFSMDVIDTDTFLEMPMSSQLLYFHLSLRADDDGFIASTKRILRLVGCGEDDLKVLFNKRFVIPFESGVCVIRHWRIHNYIQSDRYHETIYKEEKSILTQDTNGSYEKLDTECIQNVSKVLPEVRLGKASQGKVRLENTVRENPYKEIVDYFNEKSGSRFKVIKATKEFINGRFSEGYVLQDFFTVIDNKVKDWKGTEMEKYLRPSTLFTPSKFEGYLNEKGFAKKITGNEVSKELQAKGVFRVENGKYFTERGTEFDPFKKNESGLPF